MAHVHYFSHHDNQTRVIQDDFLTYDAARAEQPPDAPPDAPPDDPPDPPDPPDAPSVLTSAISLVTRTDSWDTMHSPTPVETTIIVTLPILREKIRTRPFLEGSYVVRIQVCQEQQDQSFHRFVLLELYRSGVNNIWLRLDPSGRGVVPTELRGAGANNEETVSPFTLFRLRTR